MNTASLRLNGKFSPVNLHELKEIPGVRSIAVMLTPASAQRLLERNIQNRETSKKIIRKYITEIKADECRPTPGGVGFNDRGELVDGQHRLHAIARANVAVSMMITLGLPAASQEKVDRQRRRSLFNTLSRKPCLPASGGGDRHLPHPAHPPLQKRGRAIGLPREADAGVPHRAYPLCPLPHERG
jgi:hypothetical protein